MPEILRIIISVILFACTFILTGQQGLNSGKNDTIPADSIGYELIVIDPGFETWLATQPPANFYSNEYYRMKNLEYVSEWNQRYYSGRRRGLYETYIDYDPNIDYPLELNYRLYNYFRYFEKTNRVRLSRSSR